MNAESHLQRCPLCGEPLGNNPDKCSKCDWHTGYREQISKRHAPPNQRDVIAAALSMLPGVGHIYKGYFTVGWVLLLAGVPAIFVFAFAYTMFFGWFLVPTYWIAVGVDAYLRRDLRPPKPAEAS